MKQLPFTEEQLEIIEAYRDYLMDTDVWITFKYWFDTYYVLPSTVS